jgi:hypothetical protein
MCHITEWESGYEYKRLKKGADVADFNVSQILPERNAGHHYNPRDAGTPGGKSNLEPSEYET